MSMARKWQFHVDKSSQVLYLKLYLQMSSSSNDASVIEENSRQTIVNVVQKCAGLDSFRFLNKTNFVRFCEK